MSIATRQKTALSQRKAILPSILLLAAILLAACQPAPAPTLPAPEPTRVPLASPTPLPEIPVEQLYNTTWVLVGLGDAQNPTVVPAGTVITAEFNPDGTLSGSGGCNNYTAEYQASSNGTLTVNPAIATTRMACEQGMELENAYLGALGKAQTFSFNAEGRLEITYDSGSANPAKLVYTPSQATLTDTEWVLISYGNPSAPTAVPAGSVITAVFTQEGTVSGNSGCNTYAGGYSLNGSQILVGTLASTAMACVPGSEIESAYLTALQGAFTYQITGSKLTITYDNGSSALNYTSASLPLTGTEWNLSALNGSPLAEDIEITALFVPTQGTDTGNVSGSAGCNIYNAGYTLSGSSLTIAPAASTFKACEEPVMQAEQSYLTALESTQSYQIFGNQLLLSTGAGTLTFVANRTPLQAALWVLTGIGELNSLQTPVQGSNFTAQFTRNPGVPTGVVAGTTGCNEYAAAFTASTTEIKINLPQKTHNPCSIAQDKAEQEYFQALNSATIYRIVGNSLVIPYDDNKQALVFEGTMLDVAQKKPLDELNNTSWYLWAINDKPVIPGALVTALVTINPDNQSGTLSGTAGCNSYQATFGESLGMQTTLTSLQTCSQPTGVMLQEQSYMKALSTSYGYWATGDQLIINTGQGPLTYINQPPASAADQTHMLQNITWFLYSYNDQPSVRGSAEASLFFAPNGALSGFTGCNNLNGTYTTEINQLRVTTLTRGSNPCPNNAATNQENAMMAILGSAQTYTVADTAMQIVGSQGVLNFAMTPVNRPNEIVPPTAVMIITPSQPLVGQSVTFDGSKSSGPVPIISWDWDFGDGGRANGPVVKHTYTLAGSYVVQMTVTDQVGYRGSTKATVTVSLPATPTAVPTAAPTATTAPPTATSTSAPQPTATQQPAQPTATSQPQPATATHEPSLPTVTAQPGQPTPTQAPPPTETLKPTDIPPPPPTETPLPPTETALPPTEIALPPTETLPPPPTATPVPAVPPKAVIQGATSGFVGEPVSFNGSASTAGSSPITSYAWNFGDGSSAGPASSPQATTIYNQPGSYSVQLVVTDANGQTSQATQSVNINARLNTVVWSLQSAQPGTAITLQFLNGQIAGFAGCNSYSGSYTATQNEDGTYTLTLSSVAANTKVSCSSNVMDQENSYLATLGAVTTGQIQGNSLNLSGGKGSLSYFQVGTAKPK